MDKYFEYLEVKIEEITMDYKITNLITLDDRNGENDYWVRLATLSFFKKIREVYNYHFLYEIQSLSNQIHYGLVHCIIFRDKICILRGHPNIFNHRYPFMLESSIHCIYSYWNRVGLVLNTYLKNPKKLQHVYFNNVIDQLKKDYPSLNENENYIWINEVKKSLQDLDRNEFTHNNSLIMQNFLTVKSENTNFKHLLSLPDKLLLHNQFITDDILKLVQLLEDLEKIKEY